MKRPEFELDLFSILDLIPHNGAPGSIAAAAAVAPVFSGQCGRVLEVIEGAGARGITRKDIASRLSLPESTVCARVFTLMGRGRCPSLGVVVELGDDERRFPDCGGSVRQAVLVRCSFVQQGVL